MKNPEDEEEDDYSAPWEDYKSVITKVVISEGITNVQYRAFSECSRLTSISIPSTVTSIESRAFSGCSKLVSIELPVNLISIENYAFYNCSSLESLKIPSKVTTIGNEAFEYCSSLESINIPSGVTTINSMTFANCNSLTQIVIPSEVKIIGYRSFVNCSNLTSVTFENASNLKKIGEAAFFNCENLKNIEVPENVFSISTYALGYYIQYDEDDEEEYAIIKDFTIKGANGSVAETYAGNNDINFVDNGKTVDSESITVSGTCGESINWTLNLKGELTISGSGIVEFDNSMNNNLSYYKDGIKSIIIEDGITGIGSCTFEEYTNLKEVKIPSSVKSIETSAFYGCCNLENIEISSGVASIEDDVFKKTAYYNNESNWKNGVLYIGNYLIKADSDKISGAYKVNEDTEVIADNAFEGCSGLTEVEIPSSMVAIGNRAFLDCDTLENVEIQKGVTSIGYSAFEGCTSLTSIELPEGVTSLGHSAFSNCSSLSEIKLPNSIVTLGALPFFNTAYYNDKGNWEDGALYIGSCLIALDTDIVEGVYKVKEGTTAIAYGTFEYADITSVEIPEGVKEIEGWTFARCEKLESVQLPSSLTSIGAHAFFECTSLTDIVIPASVTNIGWRAFGACKNLTNIVIEDSEQPSVAALSENFLNILDDQSSVLECIGEEAFCGCNNLTGITIPASVTEIDEYAVGYSGEYTNGGFKNKELIKDFVITGVEGSEAQTYAVKNSITFKASAQHNHTLVKVAAKAATCTAAGNTAYWTCSTCGKYFSDEEGTTEIEKDSWILPYAHTFEKVDGLVKCTKCGELYTGIWTDKNEYKDGVIVYSINSKGYIVSNGQVQKGLGVVKIGDDLYYGNSAGKASNYDGSNVLYYTVKATKTNGLINAGFYELGTDGKISTSFIYKGYYYTNGSNPKGAGVVKFNGNYYYINGSGVISNYNGLEEIHYTIKESKTNGLINAGFYRINAGGTITLNFIYAGTYYYENGTLAKGKGMVKVDDNLYYVNGSGTLYKNGTATIKESKTNGLCEAGKHTFDAYGVMTK